MRLCFVLSVVALAAVCSADAAYYGEDDDTAGGDDNATVYDAADSYYNNNSSSQADEEDEEYSNAFYEVDYSSKVTVAPGKYGYKDTTYLPYENPNVKKFRLYYGDAHNVLADISNFRKLYITYSNCAWSYKGYYGENDRRELFQSRDRTLSSREHRCGGDGGDEYWYMGFGECYSANAAYSLYGSPQGTHFSGCHEGTFINSFVTTNGLKSFSPSIDPSSTTTECTAYENAGYSMTTGCDAAGRFTTDKFYGQSCDGSQRFSTQNKLSQLNKDLANVKCELIYDPANGIDYASALLYYSEACTHAELGDRCPDPHGLVKKYERNLVFASNLKAGLTTSAFMSLSHTAEGFLGGMFLFATLFLLFAKSRKKAVNASQRERDSIGGDKETDDDVSPGTAPPLEKVRTVLIAGVDRFNKAMESPAAAVKRTISTPAKKGYNNKVDIAQVQSSTAIELSRSISGPKPETEPSCGHHE